ncbi:sugar phosphate isomerase/epimerase [Schumannella luteola]|uniref:Sugar phosphate isomerase/epimerase n=1 Tax=Schumannella luteola TaxID=472059 RepID=A0A852Y5Z7_9MICO|nr:sugar phosphate isomerase/epimerase family protein [Schumannella luteola]NYG97693.1 sugar phosphate isomerase/epimerase [Schumannella luteola]TPX01436.1 sugar phosphate isomerase/epimerase [Schumannella luteola]
MTTPTWTLSGFGDEIDPDPAIQVAVLKALGANHIEVRSAWGVNVVDLDDEQLAALADILKNAGMGVSAIASPIGKVDIALDPELEVARLRRIIRVAQALGTDRIRIFSFFRAEGVSVDEIREPVIHALTLLAAEAASAGVVLLHENEKAIYGDTPERVLDLVTAVDSPALRLAWDSANFVQVGVAHPHDDGFEQLAPYIDYLQVKDALTATGEVVPAGQGDGQVADTIRALRDRGYSGFASLEPHLAAAHELGGFSGPTAFGEAGRALAKILDAEGIATR